MRTIPIVLAVALISLLSFSVTTYSLDGYNNDTGILETVDGAEKLQYFFNRSTTVGYESTYELVSLTDEPKGMGS